MRYLRAMRRSLVLMMVVASSACAAERARGPLAIPLGLTAADTGRALRAYDFCLHDGPRTSEEMFWACDHPGLGDRDAWVIARYDGGVLVRLQRFERWADQAAARQRWDALIARRAEAGPPSTGAREQLEARHRVPAGTEAWVAFDRGDELIGVYLLSPAGPDAPAVLEEIVPAVE